MAILSVQDILNLDSGDLGITTPQAAPVQQKVEGKILSVEDIMNLDGGKAVPEEPPAKAPWDYLKDVGVKSAKALGSGLAQSVTTELPNMAGSAAEFVGGQLNRPVRAILGNTAAEYSPFAALEKGGRAVKDWSEAKAKEWFGEMPEDASWWEKTIYEGSKMLGPSLIPGGAATIAARALKGVSGLVEGARLAALAGNVAKKTEFMDKAITAAKSAENWGAAAGGVIFGLNQAQQSIDSGKQTAEALTKQGDLVGAQRAIDATQGIAPYVTGAIEAAGEFFGTKYLTRYISKALKLPAEEVADNIIKKGAAYYAKDLSRTLGVEVGTEMGQQGGEAAVEKYSGVRPGADILKETLSVIGPTAFMTLLTGGVANAMGRIRKEEQQPPPPAVNPVKDLVTKAISSGPGPERTAAVAELIPFLMQPPRSGGEVVESTPSTEPMGLPYRESLKALQGEMATPDFRPTVTEQLRGQQVGLPAEEPGTRPTPEVQPSLVENQSPLERLRVALSGRQARTSGPAEGYGLIENVPGTQATPEVRPSTVEPQSPLDRLRVALAGREGRIQGGVPNGLQAEAETAPEVVPEAAPQPGMPYPGIPSLRYEGSASARGEVYAHNFTIMAGPEKGNTVTTKTLDPEEVTAGMQKVLDGGNGKQAPTATISPAPEQGAAPQGEVSLVDEFKSMRRPQGDLERGADYWKELIRRRTNPEIVDLIRWAKAENPWIDRFVGGEAGAVLRERGVPVDEIGWQMENVPKEPAPPSPSQGKEGEKREAWEMTREEFGEYPRFAQQLSAETQGIKPNTRKRDAATQRLVDKQTAKSLQNAPDAAPDTYWDETRDLHREIVAKAIDEGKITSHPDYPDLSPKPALQPKGEEKGAEVPTTTSLAEYPVQEVPIDSLNISEDVPQFKEGANRQGVVEALAGKKYQRLGTGPIVVWERKDGRMEVITGRHRLDLARRTGEKTIPAQIVKESDGFDVSNAITFDAESNIRDNQGSTKDYANYFRNTKVDENEASSRGLLSRDKGRSGFRIGKDASDNLYTGYRAGKVSEAKTLAIASAAPGNEQLQTLGIKYALNHNAEDTANYLRAIQTIVPDTSASQVNLFGENESWQVEADKMAKAASGMIRALDDEKSALRAAGKLGKDKFKEFTKKYGVNPGNPEDIQKRLSEIERESVILSKWPTNPELVAKIREEAGLKAKGVEEPKGKYKDTQTGSLFGAPQKETPPSNDTIQSLEDQIRELQVSAFDRAKEQATPWTDAFKKWYAIEMGLRKPRIDALQKRIDELKAKPPAGQAGLFDQGIDNEGKKDVQFAYVPTNTESQSALFGFSKREYPGPLPPSQRVRVDTTGPIRWSGTVAQNAADVASLLASIRKAPQGNFYSVVTDKNGVILEVHRYVKGTRSGAPIFPIEVVGRALNVDGADSIYFAHNHPSGDPGMSAEDYNLARSLEAMATAGGLTKSTFMTIGRREYDAILPTGGTDGGKIPSASRKVLVPVVERKTLIRTMAAKGRSMVGSSASAINFIKDSAANSDGVLLLDRKNFPVAFVPFIKGRSMKDTTRDILAMGEKSGAAGMVIKDDVNSPERQQYIKSLVASGSQDMSLQAMDVIVNGRSMADSGEIRGLAETDKGKTAAKRMEQLGSDQGLSIATGTPSGLSTRLVDRILDRGTARADTSPGGQPHGQLYPTRTAPYLHGKAVQSLSSALGKEILPESVRIVSRQDREAEAVKRVCRRFGISPVFFELSPDLPRVNGLHETSLPRTIFLNANPTGHPVLHVAGHELLHTLKKNAPDLYAYLDSMMRGNLVGFQDYIDGLNALYERAGVGGIQITEEKGHEELYASFIGEQFTDGSFWDKLAKENPSFGKKILRFVQRILRSVRIALTGTASRYIADVEKAQDLVAKVMGKYAKISSTAAPDSYASLSMNRAWRQMEGKGDQSLEEGQSYGISRAEFEDMVQRQWHTVKDIYREEGINTWREYLDKLDAEALALEIESNYELYNRYLRQLPEGTYVSDVVEAYKNGTLPTEKAAKPRTEPAKIGTAEAKPLGTVGEPQKIETLPAAQAKQLWAKASERVTPTNKADVMKARSDAFFQFALTEGFAERAGIPQKELIRKFRSWSNFPWKAILEHQRFNSGKDLPVQWHGIINSAWLAKQEVTPEDIDRMVKTVDATDKAWGTPDGKSLRNYIARVLLGLDTRILFKDLTFRVESTLKPLGEYTNREKLIKIRENSPHTVSHEIGHYLDYKWGDEAYQQLFPGQGSANAASTFLDSWTGDMSSLRRQWLKRYTEFVMDISERSEIGSEYYQNRGEVFARFFAKFIDWVNLQAGERTWGDHRYAQDRFNEGDYRRFIGLLQEKAYVDIKEPIGKGEGSLSVATGTPPGLSPRLVNQILTPVRTHLPGAPELIVVKDYASLPQTVKDGRLVQSLDETTRGRIKGVHQIEEDGRVSIYMVADNFMDTRDVLKTAIHEIVGHQGIREAMSTDKKFGVFLNQLFEAKKNDPLMKWILEKYPFDTTTAMGRQKAADEWFARTVADKGHKDPTLRRWWNQFVRMFRDWARKAGFRITLSDAEISDVMNRAWRQMEGKGKTGTTGKGQALLYAGEKSAHKPFPLEDAKARIAAGDNPETVRKETGWFQGKYDKRWRFEIDDSKVKLNNPLDKVGTVKPLSEVIDHSDLFKAYPFLKDYKVGVQTGEGGSFQANNILVGVDGADKKGTIIHEIQHAIQEHEGFAVGGSLWHSQDLLRRMYDVAISIADGTNKWGPDSYYAVTKPEAYKEAQRLAKERSLSELKDEQRRFGKYTFDQFYRGLAGEIESRDVSARAYKTAEERAKTEPYSSENIPEEETIARFDADAESATMASVTKKGEGQPLLDTIASLQKPGQPRDLVPIAKLRDKMNMEPKAFDAALIAAVQSGEVTLHAHDSPFSLSEAERNKLLSVPDALNTLHKGRTYYVGVVPKGKVEQALEIAGATDSPAFRKWFGQSVVTEDGKPGGKPMVVYHGSEQPIYTADYVAARKKIAQKAGIPLPPTMLEPGFSWDKSSAHDEAINKYIAENRESLPGDLVDRAENLYRDISVFDGSYLGTNTGAQDTAAGFFFTPNENFARRFTYNIEENWVAGKKIGEKITPRGKQKIYAVYLSIQNPLDLYKITKEKAREYASNGLFADLTADDIYGMARSVDGSKELQQQIARHWQVLRDAGYDGIRNGVRDEQGRIQQEIIPFSPTQIKSIFNRGTWDASRPEISLAISDDPRANAQAAKAGNPFGGGTFTNSVDKARETLRPFLNDFMYWVVDKNHPIQSVQSRLRNVSERLDLFLSETQRPKVTASKIKEAWDDKIKPLIQKLADSKIELADFEEYAHAKHAHEANIALRNANAKRYIEAIMDVVPSKESADFRENLKEDLYPEEFYAKLKEAFDLFGANEDVAKIKERWDIFSEKPSGMTNEEATNILEANKDNTAIEEARKMLLALNNERLDILRDAGVIADEEYEAYKKKYKYYVPLYREGFDDKTRGTGKGITPAGRAVKTRMGSTRNVVNIFANSVSNYENAINRAEKAASARTFLALVKANPDPDFWSVKEVKKSPKYDSAGNIKMYPNIFEVSPNEIRVMVDGKQYLIEVNRGDKDAMLMLNTLKAQDTMGGPLMNSLSKLNRWLSRINTSWSPEFILSNFVRDIQTAGINVRDTGVESKNILRGALESIRAIYAVERGKRKGTDLEAMYDRFQKAGGKIGWADVHGSIEKLAGKISKELDVMSGNRPLFKTASEWIKWVEDANTSIENGIRLHVFRLAVNQGMSDKKAAQIASDLTVDFTKKGAAGPLINSLYLFANAGIQGSYRIMRAGAKSPEVRKIMGGIVGAGFLIGLLNSAMGGTDDDDEDYYNKIDDFVRERNMIFMLPGTKGKYVKIPSPWGYNFFFNLGDEISKIFTKKNYKPLNGAGRLASVFVGAFNPIQAGTLLQTLSPTVTDPFVQVAENKNWFGGDLMPAENKFDKTPTPDSERYWKSVSTPSRWVASTLNYLTGGNKVRSGYIDVSPETLDLILDTAGGSTLKFAKDIIGAPVRLLTKEETQLQQIPFLRRIAGEKTEFADSRLYRENITDILTAKEELKAYAGTDYYSSLFDKLKDEIPLIRAAEGYEAKLKQLRKARNAQDLRGNKEQVKSLDKTIDGMYQSFNKLVNSKMEKTKVEKLRAAQG